MRPLALPLAALVLFAACENPPGEPPPEPRLPAGAAGEVVARAIEASGGWERWRSIRDVSFVSTFILYDPAGNVTNETIGLHRSPLHEPTVRARFESLGLPEPVVIGFDGRETWMIRDGRAVPGHDQLALARFNMVSDVFWFSLPFSLAEAPMTITDLGETETHEGKWHRLKISLDEGAPEAPSDWSVVWFDTRTHLVDRIFSHVTAPFLRHRFWVGQWLDYRDWQGLRKERRRQFYPADPEGRIVGGLVAERLTEDVRLNPGLDDRLFEKPLAARGGRAT